jgi:glycogen phosphorylase
MEIEGVRFIEKPVVLEPVWKKIIVESNLPESLSPLRDLSRNLWWVWNTEARELFQYIDSKIWEECNHNPIVLLEEVSYKRFLQLKKMNSSFQKCIKQKIFSNSISKNVKVWKGLK